MKDEGSDWKKNGRGVLVPPGAADEPIFKTKVVGFQPEQPICFSEKVGVAVIHHAEVKR